MADRISALPDELLCHILSFLRTERAVATRVLSKRWTHLWRSVPALHFYIDREQAYGDKSFFLNEFVYSVLLLRDAAAPIKTFRLKIDHAVYDDSGRVNNWVNFVTQRRVEHLDLCVLTLQENPELPISILTCRTLVVLKLEGFVVNCTLSAQLPSLKILHLNYVSFESDRHLEVFLSGCPILEDLQIHTWLSPEVSLNCGELKGLNLNKLTRADVLDCLTDFPMKTFCNVKFLSIEIRQVHQDFPSFHNLTHLVLVVERSKPQLLAEMLNHCPKLQSLTLQRSCERCDLECGREYWADPDFVPECLSSNLKTCTLQDFGGLRVEFQLARYILKNARVLHTMEIFNYWRISKRQFKKLSSAVRSPSRCQIIVHRL